MEVFEIKRKAFKDALHTLTEIMDQQETDILRDATIKRFEFTFELAWKVIRIYLKENHGIVANSPKSVFREAHQIDFLDEKETELFLLMTNARNETTHLYNALQAEKIFYDIKNEYYPLLVKLFQKLK